MIYASLNAKEGNYQYPAAIKTAITQALLFLL